MEGSKNQILQDLLSSGEADQLLESMEGGVQILDAVEDALRLASQGRSEEGQQLLTSRRDAYFAKNQEALDDRLARLWNIVVEDYELWVE